MATTTTKAPSKRTAKRAADGATTLEYLQKAIDDIDCARRHASKDMKGGLDSVMDRMKDLVDDFRKRAEDEAADFQKSIEDTTEDMRRELARRAIRAQRTSDALTELTSEIRKRRADLRK
jgi:hypothetical protein